MLFDPRKIEKIRKIVEKNQARILLTMLGAEALTPSQKDELRALGLDPRAQESFLDQIYHHNYLNPHGSTMTPSSLDEMSAQQRTSPLPDGEIQEASKDFLNLNMKQLLDKHRAEVLSRVDAIIQDANNHYKMSLQRKDLEGAEDRSLAALRTKLRDLSKDTTKNWDRIVNTATSDAISLGSVDRIAEENEDKDPSEVYVYRIVVQDSALCRYCRQFYLDSDGTPKVYKLSTLLSNGSNYGKKKDSWLPTATSTHPNERCSPVIELKRGWKVLSGGSVTFIGPEAWQKYIGQKVQK